MPIRLILRAMAAVALTAAATFGLAGPALATTGYGPQSGDATVSATVVTSGHSVRVSGGGFCPGTTVTVTVSQGGHVYITQDVTANKKGRVSVRVTPTEKGRNTIKLTGETAACNNQTRVLGVKITVRSAAAAGASGPNAGAQSSNSDLPKTGGVDLTPLWAGLGLLLAGGLLVSVAQSRRRITV